MSVLSLAPASLLRTITPEQKSDLLRKLGAVQAVNSAAYGTKGEIVAIAARDLRVSKQAVHTWVSQFNRGGAAALVDGRRKRGRDRGIPQITRDWILEEYMRMQREDSGTEIYKMIRERARLWWRTENPKYRIPGFMEPIPIGPKGYPEGLSQETIRKCGPDAYQRALAHQGRKTASTLLPAIPLSRHGVGYLERIFFDDQMYDHYITEHGYDTHMRPVGFNALDFLTGAFLEFHIRLRWWDESGEKHRSLTQREFVWFVLGLLSSVGYRTDARGTCLVFEWGTANSWSSENGALKTAEGHTNFADALYAFTDGHVTIDRSGKFNKPMFKDMLFAPSSSGNFRFKAPIESMFRAVRTHGLLLPGATGLNPEMAPEENNGLEREERRWLKLANKFPAHLAEAVKSNNYSFLEYHRAYGWIYAGINADPEHNLKDWEQCGFIAREWHWEEDPPDLWRPRAQLAGLAEHVRETFEAQLSGNPLLMRTRRMSRAEAVRASEQDACIKTLDPMLYHHLLPLEWAIPVKVRNNREIHVREPLIRGAAGDLIYSAVVFNEHGHRINLSPGDELLCHLDPFRPDSLIVLDQRGRFIGRAARRPDDVLPNSEIAEDLLRARALLTADLDAPVHAAFQSVAERRRQVRQGNEALEERMRDITPEDTPAKPPRKARAPQSHDVSADPLSAPLKPETTDTEQDPFLS